MDKQELFIEKLNKATDNNFKFMLKSASLQQDADFCVLEILYKDGIILNSKIKQDLEKIILDILPKSYKYEINFIKNFISVERISDDICIFMKKTFPSMSYIIENVNLENNKFFIKIKIDNLSIDHANDKNFKLVCEKYFKNLYEDYDFEVSYSGDNVYKKDEITALKENYVAEEPDMFELRKIEFTEQVPLIGEEFTEKASYIKDIKQPKNDVIFCGTIKSVKSSVIKRKPKETDDEISKETTDNQNLNENKPKAEENNEISSDANEQTEVKYERKLYKFELADFTDTISCIIASNKETASKLEKLEAGSQIAVKGKVQEDKYSGGISFSISSLAYCKVPDIKEEVIVYHKEKPFYEFVSPEKIVTYAQDDLLSFAEVKTTPKYLENKTFVCFDFETTGLHFESGDKIIEIGAVKIENGKITERFMSYVDPERKIPPESSAISGIVDSDVAGAPKDYQVLQDFYKFAKDTIIIGYNNINFDNIFLIGQGKKCRWDFSQNKTEDVFHFAQKYVHGVKNYKLGTIAEKLGVVLDNAHRAVFDALATAEVFIKICEIIDQKK